MNFKRFHVSKNLFDKDNTTIYSAYIGNDARWLTISDGSKSIKMPVDSNTQYTLSISESNSVFRIYETSNSNPEPSAGGLLLSEIVRSTNIKQYTFTTASDTKFIVFQGVGSTVDSWFNSLMLNTGSQPLPYEPYGSTWHDIPHYIHNTSTDTLTTLPADIYANDTTATVGLKGDMQQTGTPTPQNPIQPQETGERTGNLLNLQEVADAYPNDTSFDGITLDIYGGTTNLFNRGITVDFPSGCYFSCIPLEKENASTNGRVRFIYTDDTVKEVYITKNDGTPSAGRGEIEKPVKSLRFNWSSFNSGFKFKLAMLNTGSTALPYEPYGIKIPISSASTTTPVYLGEVESTRQIKQLVLTGEENFQEHSSISGLFTLTSITDYLFVNATTTLSTHYNSVSNYGSSYVPNGCLAFFWGSGRTERILYIHDDTYTSADDFKAYLAQQYANGTPVTVWYVLATDTTGIVNEPIRKLGDYADTVSGITIPTITGKDTFDVLTTLKPSEVSLSYTGWHDASAKEWDGSEWQ